MYQHLTVFGDSITDRRNHYAHQWYYDWLADWLAIPQVTNLGISGSTVAMPYDPMVQRWQAIPKSTDLLLIYAGINDFGRGTLLGAPDDLTSSTFYGALHRLLQQVKQNYPRTQIYFISHVAIGTDFFPATNQWGYQQYHYEQAITALTHTVDIAHISLYQHPELAFTIPEQATHLSLYTLHPNDAGQLVIAKVLYQTIQKNKSN